MVEMDKYASAFADAMERTGARNTEVAALLGEDFPYSNVSLWRTGRRPIPADHAPAIAAFLGIAPEQISRSYEKQLRAESVRKSMASHAFVADAVLSDHLVFERLEDFGAREGSSNVVLPEVVVRRELGAQPIENVRWVLQRSRAMEPSIRRQSIVLVDIAVCELAHVLDGGTYAYKLWDRPDIRQISIQRDSWHLIGTNKEIPTTQLRLEDLQNLKIMGNVVGVV